MEFGRISEEELEKATFSLPPDHGDNFRFFKVKKTKTRIHIGCAKWGRKDWVGKLYPEKTRDVDFLNHYARHFNCIELNATFYKIPTKTQAMAWRNQVHSDFIFCPKISQSISHTRRLKNTRELTDRFLEGITGFGKTLGPVFLVPHPQMGPKSLEVIAQFAGDFPKEIELFIELRHPEWFSNDEMFNQVCRLFSEHKRGLVITDAAGRRDCVHMKLTNSKAFVRFVGNGLHRSDYTRIDEWVTRIQQWQLQGLEDIYFFMHQHEELHSPELCKYMIERLNLICSLNIPPLTFIQQSPSYPTVAGQNSKKAGTSKKLAKPR